MTLPSVLFEDSPAALASALGVAGLLATVAAASLLVPTPRAAAAVPAAIEAAAPATLLSVTAPSVAVVPESSPHATARACPSLELAFAPSSTMLDAHTAATVGELAEWLTAHPEVDLVLEGHADVRGRHEVNLWVSHERAATVAAALVKRGVSRRRIVVRGFGAYQPVAGAPDTDSRQRRVVVSLNARSECPAIP